MLRSTSVRVSVGRLSVELSRLNNRTTLPLVRLARKLLYFGTWSLGG